MLRATRRSTQRPPNTEFPILRALLTTLIAFLLVLGAVAGLGALVPNQSAAAQTGPLRIVVTVPPLAGLVKELAPPGSEVTALIVPGRSEHGYEFTPEDVARLARADVAVYVGLGLEPKVEDFLKTRPAPSRQVVCMADALGIRADPDHAGHEHAPDEPCDHGPVDQHLWLDPVLVQNFVPALSRSIQAAMAQRGMNDDKARGEHDARAAALIARVKALDEELREQLKPVAGEAIVTHHNAWPRLADRYGLKVAAVIRAVEGAEPTPDSIAKAVDAIQEQRVRGVFFEPQFNAAVAERIAQAAGVRLGKLDPLGDGDWFALMRGNGRSIVETLRP